MNLNNVKKYIKLRQAFADLQEQLAHVDKQFLRGEDEEDAMEQGKELRVRVEKLEEEIRALERKSKEYLELNKNTETKPVSEETNGSSEATQNTESESETTSETSSGTSETGSKPSEQELAPADNTGKNPRLNGTLNLKSKAEIDKAKASALKSIRCLVERIRSFCGSGHENALDGFLKAVEKAINEHIPARVAPVSGTDKNNPTTTKGALRKEEERKARLVKLGERWLQGAFGKGKIIFVDDVDEEIARLKKERGEDEDLEDEEILNP